jgi:SAM-dependent methyltransferase
LDRGDSVVDIGGGRSPLTKILSNICFITNVDKYPNGNWFPLNSMGDYEQVQYPLPFIPENVAYIDKDFLEWAETVPDNSFDYMYDSCSVIHFEHTSFKAKNDGCYKVGLEVKRLLKPGGYYIVASDLLHPMYKNLVSIDQNIGEFLYLENMIAVYSQAGLNLFGDINLDLDSEFYTNILTPSANVSNYNRLNHKFYNLEDWQTFANYEGTCGLNLVRGRMCFKKEGE